MTTHHDTRDVANESYHHQLEKVQKADKPEDYDIHNTAYSMIVIKLMDKVGMGPIEKIMTAQEDLEDFLAKIQGDLVTLSSFLSKIENNANSTARAESNRHWNAGKAHYDYKNQPNAYNGIDPSLYNNPAFDQEIKSFVKTFKQLFFSKNGNTGKAYKDINTLTGRDGTKYDLTSYWNKLGDAFNDQDPKHTMFSYTDDKGMHNLIDSKKNGAVASDGASLFQIYIYCKLQLEVLQKGNLGPNPDMSSIFFPDPSPEAQGSDDGICSMLTQFLESFNTSVDVQRNNYGSNNPTDKGNYESTNSGNILQLMFEGQIDDKSDANVGNWGKVTPGLKTALSYMAFNYFWTKNPNYDTQNDLNPWSSQNADWGDKGIAHGDLLSDVYASATNVQSLVGSNSQEQTTDMQEKTTVMGQFDNIGQNIISQDAKAEGNTIQNFKMA